MPSEREIDNHIDNMEAENQIYINKELKYAEKYHILEEKIDCPLEILEKGIKKFYEYDAINNCMREYTDDDFENDRQARFEIVVNLNRQEIIVIDYMDAADINIKRFKLSDYKKTWWLKKDKRE